MIGYYVHHHGAGHAARFGKIADASDDLIVPISELDLPGGVRLESDMVASGIDPTASGALHWAPVGGVALARRSLTFGRWLAEAQPAGVVVDVSVEAALLCRLFGVATVVVRQHGDRSDRPHESAYRSATRLLAPYPEALEHVATPAWVRDKTDYCGFVGHRGASNTRSTSTTATPGADDIVILWGNGGGALTANDFESIVEAAGNDRVWFAGPATSGVDHPLVENLGWVADVPGLLQLGPTVVGSAGNNVVADAAMSGCALVVVPQDRPFDEQHHHADTLEQVGAASVAVASDEKNWLQLIDSARCRRAMLRRLAADGGGAKAAALAVSGAFEASRQSAYTK